MRTTPQLREPSGAGKIDPSRILLRSAFSFLIYNDDSDRDDQVAPQAIDHMRGGPVFGKQRNHGHDKEARNTFAPGNSWGK